MSPPVESVVLCEGVHDRAFWKGWLEHLGCEDARPRRGDAVDPFGETVRKGHFAFFSKEHSFVRVTPCFGDTKVLQALKNRLPDRTTHGLHRLVVNLDTDADAGDPAGIEERTAALRAKVEAHASHDAQPVRLPDGDLAIDRGATLISVVLWSAGDPALPHLPAKETLERLVCAAIVAAHPTRGEDVAAWLGSRRGFFASSAGLVKEHAWSHMAGWYADGGCDEFYQAVWRDEAVAIELEARLRPTGAWRVAEALASE
jgi:hypothetical protein